MNATAKIAAKFRGKGYSSTEADAGEPSGLKKGWAGKVETPISMYVREPHLLTMLNHRALVRLGMRFVARISELEGKCR